MGWLAMVDLVVVSALVACAVVSWRRRPRRLGILATSVTVAVFVAIHAVLRAVAWLAATGVLALIPLLLLVAVLWLGGRYHLSHPRTVVTRWGTSVRRKAGVASTLDILRVGSRFAMRRDAARVRPSLGELSRRERARVPATEYAMPLCRAGLLRVWSSVEDVVLMFGGPRTGKSGLLSCRIIDAPGAVVVTSTRTDLYEGTAALRSRRGPVHVFSPVGLGGMDSTITFDPVSGCANPVTAAERAADMLPGEGSAGERDYWVGQARRVLAALLHAAALGDGLSMQDIAHWIAAPDQAKAEVVRLLRRSPDPHESYATSALQFLQTNERTRSSITATIRPALEWLTSPHARAAATGGVRFDVAELLRSRATVYMLGAQDGQTAPLVAALTGHIAREARRIAACQPGGRLDPPLTLALDEAALICPIPLPDWTADMGGRGVHIVAAFQSRAQLITRWGQHGAATTITNAGSVLLFGGTRDRDDLLYWSTLFGDRDEVVDSTDSAGRVTGRSSRPVSVFTPAQLSNLPRRTVVVCRKYMPPVIGRATMAWERRDVRAQATLTRAAGRAVVTAAPRPAPGASGAFG
jgi:hypothetical protein